MMNKNAVLSPCGAYRYMLTRRWATGPLMPFVMLNPSTADAEIDDPTIRRCIGFAKREGAAGIVVGNVYAFRATNPAELRSVADPFGPDNSMALSAVSLISVANGLPVVCAWGNAGEATDRHHDALVKQGARLVCLGKTKKGHPRHPLYVRADQPFEPFP